MNSDATKEQMPARQIQEQEGPKEIVLDKDVAKAFGRLLRQQIFPTEDIATILKQVESIQPAEDKSDEGLAHFTSSAQRIIKLVEAIEHAKEVRLIRPMKELPMEWDFKFSEERDMDIEKPQPGEITVDKDLFSKVRSAMHHNFNNSLIPILGIPELSSIRTQNENIREQCQNITETAKKMASKFSNTITLSPHGVKLITDSEGITTLIPISDPKPQAV